jgi:hypothetical protein
MRTTNIYFYLITLAALFALPAQANTNIVVQNLSQIDMKVNNSDPVYPGGFKVTNFPAQINTPYQNFTITDTGQYCSPSEANATDSAHPDVFTNTSSGGGDKTYNLAHAWKFSIVGSNGDDHTFCMPLDRGNIGCTLAQFSGGNDGGFEFQSMNASNECVGQWFSENKETVANVAAEAYCMVAEQAFKTLETAVCEVTLLSQCAAAAVELDALQGGPENIAGDIDSILFDGFCDEGVTAACRGLADDTSKMYAAMGGKKVCRKGMDYVFLKAMGG